MTVNKIPNKLVPLINGTKINDGLMFLFQSIVSNEHQPKIIRHLKEGKLRICDIVKNTGISRKSVNNNLRFLIEKNLVGKELKDITDKDGYLFFLLPLGIDYDDFSDALNIFLKTKEIQMVRISKGIKKQ